MNVGFELQQAINQKDYDRFKQLVDNGAQVNQRLFNNNTVLHLLASIDWKISATQSVKSLFRPVSTIIDWLELIKISLPKAMLLKEFFTLQNDEFETCMHIAIKNENWSFAQAILGVFYIKYFLYPDLYRRNLQGITESELFLILYGLKGRKEQFQILFEKEECSLKAIKMATKAFKIINLNYVKSVVLPSTHRYFNSAVELDYPQAFSEIRDMIVLEQVYEENGVVDPDKESRARKRSQVQKEIDRISYEGSLNANREHVLSFLKSYADVLLSQNYDKNYIITCAREFCDETPSFFMENLSEDVVSNLNSVSKLEGFSQYSQLIATLITKFRN